jgi:hypothetical protein
MATTSDCEYAPMPEPGGLTNPRTMPTSRSLRQSERYSQGFALYKIDVLDD